LDIYISQHSVATHFSHFSHFSREVINDYSIAKVFLETETVKLFLKIA